MLYLHLAQAESLGRLFYSPEQRALLEHARRTMPMQTGETAPTPSTPDYTLKGVVTRSDGQRSVWLNDQVQYGKGKEQERNQVQVQLPSGSVQLKVGQTYDPDSGKVVESFRRPPPVSQPVPKPPAARTPAPNPREDERDAEKTNP